MIVVMVPVGRPVSGYLGGETLAGKAVRDDRSIGSGSARHIQREIVPVKEGA